MINHSKLLHVSVLFFGIIARHIKKMCIFQMNDKEKEKELKASVDSSSRSYLCRCGFGVGHEKLILALVRTIL